MHQQRLHIVLADRRHRQCDAIDDQHLGAGGNSGPWRTAPNRPAYHAATPARQVAFQPALQTRSPMKSAVVSGPAYHPR